MKTETIQIPAREVRKGDVTPWGIASGNAYRVNDSYFSFQAEGAVITPSNQVIVSSSRPVVDPCPRGRMSYRDANYIHLEERHLGHFDQSTRDLICRRLVALWNEAEAAVPYRTTAEIEGDNDKSR